MSQEFDAAPAAAYRPGYEVAAEQILSFISERGLGVGDRLPTEQELATQLGISRSVTREAIKVLSAVGRIRTRRGAGMFVNDSAGALAADVVASFNPTSSSDVGELLEFREVSECAAASLAAARATPAQVQSLLALAQASVVAAGTNDSEKFNAADEAFHIGVATASHNFMLGFGYQVVKQLNQQTVRLIVASFTAEAVHDAATQHVAIAEAISLGDATVAESLMSAHIQTTRRLLSESIAARMR